MTTDLLLEILEKRGLRVEYVDGAPRLKGPREAMTPALVRVLKRHRPEIDRRLAPKAERRVVLVAGDGSVEKVLEELARDGDPHGRTRRLAAEHVGRNVAAEWRHPRGWVRYLVIRYPEVPCAAAPTTTSAT